MRGVTLFGFLLTIVLVACASKVPSFYFSDGGVVRVKASAQDVESAREELLRVTSPSTIQSGMEGGALFEGTVRSVMVDGEGNRKVSLRVDKAVFGLLNPAPEVLEVVTPPMEYGGVYFREGEKYRVYAVKLEGRYQTWSLTGTGRLQPDWERPK